MALSVIYGLSVETDGMDYITMAENGLQLLSNNIAPSGSLWAVDIFPFRTCCLHEGTDIRKLTDTRSENPTVLVSLC